MSTVPSVVPVVANSLTVPVDSSVELTLVERISLIEDALKDLKRAARNELKSRRRRRAKRNADGTTAPKGETPEQLKAWHEEVRKVWDEMRKADEKTPYKHAVAEASARRKTTTSVSASASVSPSVSASVPVPVNEVKKVKKVLAAATVSASASASAAPVASNTVVAVDASKKRVVKKAA